MNKMYLSPLEKSISTDEIKIWVEKEFNQFYDRLMSGSTAGFETRIVDLREVNNLKKSINYWVDILAERLNVSEKNDLFNQKEK